MAGNNSKGVRAGRAFVELFLEDNRLYRGLSLAKAKLQAFGASMAAIGVRAAAVGGAMLAPLTKAATDAATRGRDITALADRFGLTAESVSTLAGAFDLVGASGEEFAGVMDGIAAKVKHAADANDELIQGLRGLNGRQLLNMPLDKQLDAIAAKFGTIKNPIDQATVAQELFGASGLKLLPYLKDGAKGFARLKDEAVKAGAVMSGADARAGSDATKALNTIWVELKNTIVAVGSALLPTSDMTKDFTTRVREAFSEARKWISENRGAIVVIAKLAAGLVAGGVALIAFNAALGIGFGILSTIGTVIGALLSPLGIATAAVVGLTAAFLTQTETGRKMCADLGNAFTGMGQTFRETWGGVVERVKAGDLQGAFAIVAAGVKTLWAQLMLALRKGWNDFMKWTVDALRANPWILPLIGGIVGGLTAGPVGALAGAAAGAGGAVALEAFGDKLKDVLAADTVGAEARVRESQAELRNLIAKGKGVPAQMDAQGNPMIGGMVGTAAWIARYFGGAKKPDEMMQELFSGQKGIFSGPAGQQLGIGSKIAQRQLDVAVDMNKGIQQVAKGVNDLGKNKLVFGGN